MRETFQQIVAGYGGEEIKSRNPHMDSYGLETGRVNYYFTTGTVTHQTPDGVLTKFTVFDAGDIEGALEKFIV